MLGTLLVFVPTRDQNYVCTSLSLLNELLVEIFVGVFVFPCTKWPSSSSLWAKNFVFWDKTSCYEARFCFIRIKSFQLSQWGFNQQHSCPWTKCMLRLYLTETACCLLLPWSVKSTDERLLLMWYTQGKGAYMNAAWSRQQEIDAWRWTYCSKGRRVLDVCIKCRRL